MPRLVQNVGDGYSFPLGIAYISGSMKKAGFKVYTLNLNHIHGDVSDIISHNIKEKGIDVVATGGLSFQYNTVKRVVDAAKGVSSKVITIVGGGIISGDPKVAMEALENVDYGVIGEGEITMNELCHFLEEGGKTEDVEGIIFEERDCYLINRPRKELKNLDLIPWPDYNGFDINKYLTSNPPGISGMNRKNIVFMLASRSCPYNCTFCFHTTGRKYRQRSLDDFFAELDSLVLQHKIDYICLADELFSNNIDRVKNFCKRIKKYKIKWWAQFRVGKNITVELLNILKDSGCDVMTFGLESADNRVLKSMRKDITVEQIEKTLSIVYKVGISFEGAFIFGDIAETNETAKNTIDWWQAHPEYKINLNLITVYPGSYLYKYACEKGIIENKVKFLIDGCPQINVSKMTDDELSGLVKKIMEIPFTHAKTLSSMKLEKIDYQTGRFGTSGECVICEHKNKWKNIKLFATNFLPCSKCGQRYNISLFPELRANIENNISKLLNKYGEIAIWGINYHTSDLFRNSSVLINEKIFPIDISESKRKMDLYGKTIFSPTVIKNTDIKAIVIAIPIYFTQIASQIEANHKQIVSTIDICRLIDPKYNP